MKYGITQFIKTCLEFQETKLVRVKNKEPMILTDTPVDVFDKVSMDIVKPLPVRNIGNSYIFTIQDNLTKYSLTMPLVNITSEDIAKAFTEHFICKFGSPKAILTDQGPCYEFSYEEVCQSISHQIISNLCIPSSI